MKDTVLFEEIVFDNFLEMYFMSFSVVLLPRINLKEKNTRCMVPQGKLKGNTKSENFK